MQLNPFHKSFRKRFNDRRALRQLAQHTDHSFSLLYAKNKHSELSRLCQKYGTDKGAIDVAAHPMGNVHNYVDFYEIIFGGIRKRVAHVLECGILHGDSLRTWKEYFPNALVTGIDINETTLFNEDRIETYLVDQTDPVSIKNFLMMVDNRQFNIIIDDGWHTADAGIALFNGVINNLANDGIYIIEDVKPADLLIIAEYFARHRDHYHLRFINLYRPNKSLGDNSLVMITKHTEKNS